MKRFTETTKWRDPWFRKLTPSAKLLWLYLCDHCDNAGVIEIDLEAAAFDIGQPINEQHLAELKSRLQAVGDRKQWIIKFIDFQYGNALSPKCIPHLRVLELISAHSLPYDNTRVVSRVVSTHKTGKGQEEDKERKEGGVGETRSPSVNGSHPPPTADNSEHKAFIEEWTKAFKAKFGFEYQFEGGRDGRAVKLLLGMKVPPVELLKIAKRAWSSDEFGCKQAATIYGFHSNFNKIGVELKKSNAGQKF